MTAAGPVVAVVPVRSLAGAKSRLGEVLDAEEREELVAGLLRRTLDAIAAAPSVARTIVVSPDEAVLDLARELGATPLRQLGSGLNAALDEARAAALELGAGALLVVPGDLPRIDPAAVGALVAARPSGPSVVLVADRHGSGTNALLLTPAAVIAFAFGDGSRGRHRALAAAAGAAYAEIDGPLVLDLDTPEDLLAANRTPG